VKCRKERGDRHRRRESKRRKIESSLISWGATDASCQGSRPNVPSIHTAGAHGFELDGRLVKVEARELGILQGLGGSNIEVLVYLVLQTSHSSFDCRHLL
jgi:hypothetical protein